MKIICTRYPGYWLYLRFVPIAKKLKATLDTDTLLI